MNQAQHDWNGHLRVREAARHFATRKPLKARRVATAFHLVGAFAELIAYEEGEEKCTYPSKLIGKVAGKFIVAICLWCGARGVDPQEGFEEAWREFHQDQAAVDAEG